MERGDSLKAMIRLLNRTFFLSFGIFFGILFVTPCLCVFVVCPAESLVRFLAVFHLLNGAAVFISDFVSIDPKLSLAAATAVYLAISLVLAMWVSILGEVLKGLTVPLNSQR